MRTCSWLLAALACVGVSGSGWAQSAPASADGRVVDYWIGDFPLGGKITRSGAAQSEQAAPTNTRVKLWLHEDGVPRISAGACTAGLFPAKGEGAITLQTGGKFIEDLAYAGSAKNCGKNAGDVDVEVWDVLTPTAEGMQISVRVVRNIVLPYPGRLEVEGQGVLRPIYKRVPSAEELADAKANPRTEPAAAPAQTLASSQARESGPPSPKGLDAAIDQIVTADSNGWMFLRYDRGSMKNAHVVERSADKKISVIYGDYTYNGGTAGWVKVRVVDGKPNCLEYWDHAGRCRPVGTMSYGSQLMIGALVAGITAPRSSGGGQHCTPAVNGHDRDGRPIVMGEYCN